MNKWTRVWPNASGTYWFYGFRNRYEYLSEKEPKIYFVRVNISRSGYDYIADGEVMTNCAVGLWMPANLPEVPNVSL
jgi:hypothetical protein